MFLINKIGFFKEFFKNLLGHTKKQTKEFFWPVPMVQSKVSSFRQLHAKSPSRCQNWNVTISTVTRMWPSFCWFYFVDLTRQN